MKEVNDGNFEHEVLNSEMPVIIDFWAPWCGPCRMISPLFENLSEKYKEVKFVKCNVDENPLTSGKFNIRSIPQFITFSDGEIIDNIVGTASLIQFQEIIGKLI